jgi:hypothetical protein
MADPECAALWDGLSLGYEGPPLFVDSDSFVNTAHLHTQRVPLECSWNDALRMADPECAALWDGLSLGYGDQHLFFA